MYPELAQRGRAEHSGVMVARRRLIGADGANPHVSRLRTHAVVIESIDQQLLERLKHRLEDEFDDDIETIEIRTSFDEAIEPIGVALELMFATPLSGAVGDRTDEVIAQEIDDRYRDQADAKAGVKVTETKIAVE